MQDICTAALVRAKQLSHCSVLLCKIASQHACATAIAPLEICPSYRRALMQDQCTAAVVKTAFPLFSAALQTSLTAALCHCNHTYGDLPFIQVCTDARHMHCSTGQGKTASPQFSAALQTSLTACLCHCNYTYGDLPLIQVCTDARHMHCSTGQGKTASPQFSAALQTSLTACLCHCNHTYGDLPFKQMCTDANPMHCSSGQNSFPTVQCCSANQPHSSPVSLQSHLWRFALHTGVH